VWDAFQHAIFVVIDWFYGIAHDWGLAIILITILFRIIIYPITNKQFKSTYQMQKMQPLIAEIKEKYANDQQRQQEEMTKIYQEAKFNPLSGCLPMILQMPIFIALFWVLQKLPDYIVASGRPVETALPATFYNLIPDLSVSPSTVFADQGIFAVIPYALLVLLFGVSMVIPLLINKSRERQTLIMTAVMAVVMLWFGWSAPAGVLLYWDVSSLLGVGQQAISRKLLEKKDIEKEAIEIKPVKVEVDRKTKKARPKKLK
jgi:YidC/Oxa1 family membrane protein insertase